MKALLALLLAGASLAAAAAPVDGLRVLSSEGRLRSWRFETEPWPLEAGDRLNDGSRVELDPGAVLRLCFGDKLDLCLAGPARLALYQLDIHQGDVVSRRQVLRLEEGALLVDGRFQFDRPLELVLALPERSLALPPNARFFALAQGGASRLYLPADGGLAVAADLSNSALVALPGAAPAAVEGLGPALFTELTRTVKLLVIARDYDQDLGQWPHPAVLGPLLAERLAKLPGLQLVDGSGATRLAYAANGALKKGDDSYLRELGRSKGARWVLAGNDVSLTPPQEEEPSSRVVLGQAEARLLECSAAADSQELVTEAAVTRVARAGRALELSSRQAQEAAADRLAYYMEPHLLDLLAGRSHPQVLEKLVLENATQDSVRALRDRLDRLDAVARFFRRAFAQRTASFDLVLRQDEAELDRQWAALPADGDWRFKALPSESGVRRFRAQAVR
ncbi:MAG TPA: hypothetical protein VNZ54_09770 [bacterium]|nr:hypothetical protein [bacterium]